MNETSGHYVHIAELDVAVLMKRIITGLGCQVTGGNVIKRAYSYDKKRRSSLLLPTGSTFLNETSAYS